MEKDRTMVVLKFGGTSVADAQPIARAAEAVAREAAPRAVVVSALAGVTDRLAQIARVASDGRANIALGVLDRLVQRHHDLATQFPGPTPAALTHLLDEHRATAEHVVRSAAASRSMPPPLMDELLATGELMSSSVVASAFERLGLRATAVDARQVIATDDQHTAAVPAIDATRERVDASVGPLLADGAIPVVGGFVGSTRDGVTTTLGRGGSDVTAALLGVCLRAREVQIWTDVDGVLDADPRLVRRARTIAHLSFGEAGDLARFGAKVLHPSTIDVVVAHAVPVRVLNSRRPDGAGTLVDDAPQFRPAPIAMACRRGLVTVAATPRSGSAGALTQDVAALIGVASPAPIVVTTTDGHTVVVVDDPAQAADLSASLQDVADVRVARDAGLIAVVGDAACGRPDAAAEVLAALDGLTVDAASTAMSARTIVLFVDDADVPEAMARLHERFCSAGLDVDAASLETSPGAPS